LIPRPPIHTPSDAAAVAEGCYFDRAKAHRVVRWIEDLFNFHFYRWQRRLFLLYIGWRRGDGSYRFTRITCFVPKKNGKSTAIAVFAGFKLFELKHGRIFSSAFNAMQAKIVMEQLIRLCKESPKLKKLMKPRGKLKAFCSPFRRDFSNEITGSKYVALADNPKANDGLIYECLIVDEIHQMKNAQVDIVMGGAANNPDATIAIISTAGSGDKTERCWQEYTFAKAVLAGHHEDGTPCIDTRLLAIVHEHPDPASLKGADIYTIEALLTANPILQECPDKRAEAMREIEKAKAIRNDNGWRRYRLGQWVQDDGDPFIDAATYHAAQVPAIPAPELAAADAYVGMDRGGTWDLTAATILFKLADGRIYEHHITYAAADRLPHMAEKDDLDYSRFVDAGEIVVVPAEAVLDEWIAAHLITTLAAYRVQAVAGDPHLAAYILETLASKGYAVTHVQQSNNRALTPTIEAYADGVRQHRIVHSANSLFDWQLGCARKITASKDSCKIVKAGSTRTGKGGAGHIDSVDAVINAMAALRAKELESAAGRGSRIYVS
jgi:phage terminase large subunit-like protein